MTDCREQRWLFQELGNRKVEVDFGGGYLSSDGSGNNSRPILRVSEPGFKRQKQKFPVGVSPNLNTRLSTAGLKHDG